MFLKGVKDTEESVGRLSRIRRSVFRKGFTVMYAMCFGRMYAMYFGRVRGYVLQARNSCEDMVLYMRSQQSSRPATSVSVCGVRIRRVMLFPSAHSVTSHPGCKPTCGNVVSRLLLFVHLSILLAM